MPKECCTFKPVSIVKVSDPNSCSVKLTNIKRENFLVCKVDGCLHSGNGRKCDYLVSLDEQFTLLIELKKSDLNGAAKQLDVSFSSDCVKERLTGRRLAMIVSEHARMPRFDTFLRKKKDEFAKRHKSLFMIAKSGQEYCPYSCSAP